MAIKAVDATQLDLDLLSVGNAIRAKGGTSASLSFPDGMVDAISNISTGTTPTGNINITTNGTYNVSDKATANVQVPTGTARSASDVTFSGRTVTVPQGLYESQVQKSVTLGAAGTPIASKGSVSNHSISVTPSVTSSTGYITGSTKSGSPVTVSASELVSGTRSITSNGTGIDVTNYKYVDVSVMSGGGRMGNPVTMTYSSSTAGSATGYYHYRFARVETAYLIGFFAYPSYRVTTHEGEEYDYLVNVFYNAVEGDGLMGYLFCGASYVRYIADTISDESDRLSVNVSSFDVSISTPVSQSGDFLMFADDSDWVLIPIYSQ